MYTLKEFTKCWKKDSYEIVDGKIERVSETYDGNGDECICFTVNHGPYTSVLTVLKLNSHIEIIKNVLGDNWKNSNDEVKCVIGKGGIICAIFKNEDEIITPNELVERAFDLGVKFAETHHNPFLLPLD